MDGTFNLIYDVVDDNGCSGSASINVVIHPNPVISLSSIDPTSCQGNDGSFEVQSLTPGLTNGTVIWSGSGSGNSGNVNIPVVISNLGSGVYNVQLTSVNGCLSNQESTTLSNPGQPIINPFSDVEQCGGSFIVPDYSSITGTNLTGNQAFFSTTGGFVIDQIAAGTTITSANSPAVIYVYDRNGGCEFEDTFTVVVNPLPTISVTNSGPVCAGESITLSESGMESTSWVWTASNGATIINPNSNVITIADASDDESFTVTGTDDNGCEASEQTTVIINPLPIVDFSPDIVAGCAPMDVIFTESGNNTGSTYSWDFGDGNSGIPLQ